MTLFPYPMKKHVNKAIFLYAKIFVSFLAFSFVVVLGIYGYYRLNRTCEDCNVILISIDTLRSDHMSAYGYSKGTTPTIESLSKKSLVFTNIRTQVPATYPSFASLMTGISPFDSGIFNNSYVQEVTNPAGGKAIPSNYTTLAEILKAKGYTTKAYMTNYELQKDNTNINQGFNSYEFINTYEKPYEARKPYEEFINKSIKWIGKNKDNKFFLWVHLMDPHSPYVLLSDSFQCTFATTEQCNTIRKEGLEKLEELRKKLEGCPEDKATQEQIRLLQSLYDGSIYQADQYVNSILQSVLKNNIGKKTMIIIYGDHGEGFDHDFNFAHGHALYDSSLRIPVIIRHPHIRNKITIDSFGTNANLFDLILHLLDAKNITKKNVDAQLYSEVDPIIYSTNTEMTKLSITNSTYKYIYSNLETCIYKGSEGFPQFLSVIPNLTPERWEETYQLDYNPFAMNKFSGIPKMSSELYPKQWEEMYQIRHDPYEKSNLMSNYPESTIPIRLMLYYYLNSKKIQLPENLSSTDDKSSSNEFDKLRSLGY